MAQLRAFVAPVEDLDLVPIIPRQLTTSHPQFRFQGIHHSLLGSASTRHAYSALYTCQQNTHYIRQKKIINLHLKV